MTDTKRDEVMARLAQLRAEYAERLPRELRSLKVQASALVNVPSASGWRSLHRRLHKLAGSAGSFGFADLGARARVLEMACQRCLNHLDTDADKRELLRDVAQLQSGQVQPAAGAPRPVGASEPVGNCVYLLEDDGDLAAQIVQTLSNFGYQVVHYGNLTDAEQAIKARQPDFLVADVMFTDEARETTELIARLQASMSEPLSVVFISSRDDFEAYLSAVRAGAVGYFVKPLDMPRLVDCLESHLNLRQAAPYRVLIVDDDAVLAQRYELVLQAAGMRVEAINDPRQVLQAMREFCPEMVLLDLNLPECQGYELAQVIRLNPDWLQVAIAYLSAEQDEGEQIEAVRRGGEDFLTKPISDARLVSAVKVRAARSRQLSDAIDRDSLTGLLKHGRIKEQIGVELRRAERQKKPLSVAMVDLDFFKKVNDTHGHAVGDRVIRALSQLLRQRLRKTDSVGRYGGEEFVAILPECEVTAARALLDELRESFAKVGFKATEQDFRVTLSAGVACATEGQGTPDELLERADWALYEAKKRGRNRVSEAN